NWRLHLPSGILRAHPHATTALGRFSLALGERDGVRAGPSRSPLPIRACLILQSNWRLHLPSGFLRAHPHATSALGRFSLALGERAGVRAGLSRSPLPIPAILRARRHTEGLNWCCSPSIMPDKTA